MDIVTQFSSSINAKLDIFVNESEWKWPKDRRTPNIAEDMIVNIPLAYKPLPLEEDSFRWLAYTSGTYTTKSPLKLLINTSGIVP